jgi:hypothetical protein
LYFPLLQVIVKPEMKYSQVISKPHDDSHFQTHLLPNKPHPSGVVSPTVAMSRSIQRTLTPFALLAITTMITGANATKYTCTMDMKHPFNEKDPSQEFVVECTVPIPWDIYAWIGGVLGGLVLVYLLIACCFRR